MSNQNSVSLSLPDKVSAALGQSVSIKVGITDFSGRDREILIRLVGSLSGPLPAVSQTLVAHLSTQVELPMMVPAGMPPGDHPLLIEVLERSTGAVLGSGEVFLEVQRTRSVAMHLSPPSIRRRIRGKVRVVLRNHDDQTHFIRMRTESDDKESKIKLLNQEIELRAGEMVRIKGRLRVRPFFVGKQKEHWYSIIGEGAGAPIYSRGNIRHIPMIGRNVKSVMGLMCVVLVWAGATLAIVRAVNPVTKDSTASAANQTDQGTDGGSDSGSSGTLELPTLIDVSGKVTAVPDGSGVTVKWRSVTIGDVEGSGKVSGSSVPNNPNVANLSTNTDDKGAFSVTGLDASALYEFSFSKSGHKTQTIIVQPKGEPVSLEIALEVGDGTISGITVDELGNPLGGVNVKLTDGNIVYQTTTPTDGDLLGKFSFSQLSTPATWVIDAQSEGRGLASTTVTLEAGGAQQDINLVVSPNVTTLSGVVSSTLFAGGNIPVVTITATDGVTTRSTSSMTDRSLAGQFRLDQLPVGRTYTVTYVADGFVTYTEIIDLSTTTSPREIQMTRSSGRMIGTVTVNSDTIEPPAVAISISNNSNSYKSTNLVADNGQYVFSNIAPGHYIVVFEALGLEDQIFEVDIGIGTTAVIDATLSKSPDTNKRNYLSFKVVKDNEDENQRVQVSVAVLHRAPDDCGSVDQGSGSTPDSDCAYQLSNIDQTNESKVLIDQLNAGAYYLVFTASGYAPKIVQTTSKTPKINNGVESKDEQIEVSLEALGSLTGQVTDSSGAPVEGVQLVLTSANGTQSFQQSKSNGEFTFSKSLDTMTYTVSSSSSNFADVTRTVTGALNTTVNVDLTVRGISTVTGEVRSLNLNSGNYEAVEPKNFAVFYRLSVPGNTVTTGNWQDTKEIGISKSLGSFRLGLNPEDVNGNQISYDACVVIIDGTVATATIDSSACDSALTGATMPIGLLAKASRSISLQVGETAVRSIYFSPSSGSLTGYVTVGGVKENDVKIEARRIGPDGRIYETVSGVSKSNGSQKGYYSFDYLTPTAPIAPTNYDSDSFSPCDQSINICWSIRATKTSVGSSDSSPFIIYPSKRLNIPATNNVDIELGLGQVAITLSDDTGTILSNVALTLTATINGDPKTKTATTNINGKAIFDQLEIGTWNLSLPVTVDFAAVNRDFTVSQGVSLNESVILRSLRGKIVFYLRGPNGPLSGAEIRVAPESGGTSTTSSTTTIAGGTDTSVLCTSAADGSCVIEKYATGVHTFIASAADLSSTTISASVIGGQTVAVSATLGASSGSLTVTLLDVLGGAVSGAVITIIDQASNPYSCTTNQSGSCTRSDLPFGIVDVKAEADNYRNSFGSISIGSGGSAMTLIATPTNGVAVFVFIDEDGQPLYDVKAEYLEDGQPVESFTCSPDVSNDSTKINQCKMTGLPQGLVDIRASVTGTNSSKYSSVTSKVSVLPGLDTGATFIIPSKNAALSGRVIRNEPGCTIDITSCGVGGSIITATDNSGKSEITLSASDGQYSFSKLAAGQWNIRAISTGFDSYSVLVDVPVINQAIPLTALPGSIELSLRTPIGGRASGINVTVQRLITGASVYSKTTTTDGDAFFTGNTIVAGNYEVKITDSIVPPRYASQTFLLNVDRGSATRFAVYLGSRGAFVAIPIAGIPALAFGPSTPLSLDVALVRDGIVYHQVETALVGSLMTASFAGVVASDNDYSIVIQSSGTITSQNKIPITGVVRDINSTTLTFTTSTSHGLVQDDIVSISGFTDMRFNANNAKVLVATSTTFTIDAITAGSSLPTTYPQTFVTKNNGLPQWNTSSHTVVTNSQTYVVPIAPEVKVSELSSVIALGTIELVVQPVSFNVEVTGIPQNDPSVTTTSPPGSTTLPLLGNAKITLFDGYLLNSVSETTNNSGVATFTDIPPGTYTAVVSNTSYDDYVTTIEVLDSSNPAGNHPKISLSQTPVVGSIEVTVTADGNDSNFVSGATISILENNTTCVTDVDGVCELKNLQRGDYQLRVIHPRYPTMTTTSGVHVTGGLQSKHQFKLGSTSGAINFTVLDSDTGAAINGGSVTYQTSNPAKSCLTSLSGTCSISGLALKGSSFVVEKTGYSDGYIGVDVTGGLPTNVTINLVPALPVGNTLSVTVVDSVTQQGLNDAQINDTADNSVICATSGISPKGVCSKSGLDVGNLSVKATLLNYEPAYATVVMSSRYTTTLVLSMRPKLGSLTFNVNNAVSSSPLAAATISDTNNNTLACSTSSTTPNVGKCTISNLSLRNYTFLVEAAGFNDAYVSYAITNEGGNVQVSLTPEGNTIIIQTTDAVTESPLSSVSIKTGNTILCDTSLVNSLATCTSTTSLTSGTYPLVATRVGYETSYASVVVSGNNPTVVNFAMRPNLGSMTFVVKDADTLATIPGAQVTGAVTPTKTCTTPASPSTSGTCTISQLDLIATPFDIAASGYANGYTNVTVTNIQNSQVIVYLSKAATSFKVYTVDATNSDPVNGATVTYSDGATLCSSTTSSGYCESANLPSGTISVKVTKVGYLPSYGTITIRNSGAATLTVSMAPLYGEAHFTVINGSTLAPLVNATITRTPGTTSVCTISDASGCTVGNFVVGTYIFTATSPGYIQSTLVATIITSGVAEISMVVYPNTPTTNSLTVHTFKESDGSQLDGVTVVNVTNSATGTELCSAVTTSGSCTATSVPVGNIAVKASLPGYSPTFGNVTISAASPASLYLYLPTSASAPPTTGNITFSFKKLSDSSNLDQATVTEVVTENAKTCTSATGIYLCTINSLSLTAKTFTVTRTGYATAYVVATPTGGNTSSITVYLTANAAAAPTTGTLSVRVVDASSGTAISTSTVTNISNSQTCSTSAGDCSFSTLAVATYNLSATKDGYENGYATVSVQAGETTSVLIALRPISSTLTVTVLTDNSTSPIAGATVSATLSVDTTTCSATSTTNVYKCNGLTTGDYSLSVTKSGYSSATATISVAKGSQNSAIVYLIPYGGLTVSTTKQSSDIIVSVVGLSGVTCTISGTPTTPPGSGSCNLAASIPYGTWIISLNTSPVKTATVSVSASSTSVTIS